MTMKNIFKTLTVIALLFTVTSAFAAVDMFLKLDGIKGEAKGKSFTVPIDQNGKAQATNLPSGDYKIVMCATGEHIKQAKLFVRKQGTEQHDYMKNGGQIEIQSFSFGATQTGFKGGVSVASGDVNGDGRADVITSANNKTMASGGGGGAGKASFSDLSFSMKTSGGKPASYGGGGGSGKVQMQDFHFMMKPNSRLGNDMFSGEVGSMTIGGLPGGNWAVDSFFDVFFEINLK
jgi:hypothetical protein